MLHNKASEGLVKTDRVGYDLCSNIAGTKANFLKYCKQFERRIRTLVPDHRVVPAGDGEASTTISVLGFLVDAKAKKKTFAPQKVDLQFLENHKALIIIKKLLHSPTLPATATLRFTLTAARGLCSPVLCRRVYIPCPFVFLSLSLSTNRNRFHFRLSCLH
jgi:hypothetical protein